MQLDAPTIRSRIMICSAAEARAYISSNKPLAGVISLLDPQSDSLGNAVLKLMDVPRLSLRCIDVSLATHDAYSADHPTLAAFVPQATHVQQAVAFAEQNLSKEGVLLIHCTSGYSRSAAIGLAVIAAMLAQRSAKEAVQLMFDLNYRSVPNTKLLLEADQLLGFQGELVRAVTYYKPPIKKPSPHGNDTAQLIVDPHHTGVQLREGGTAVGKRNLSLCAFFHCSR